MLVGRETEHVLLDRWLHEAAAGQPRLVMISGEAGIGKTTLLESWAAGAGSGRTRLLMGSAFEHVLTPFLPLAAALDALPGVGDLFIDPSNTDAEHADLRLHLAVTRALCDAATRRPTLLAIDDVHWADQGTLGLLQHLVATIGRPAAGPTPRLLVVVTVRTDTASDTVAATLRRLEREPITRQLRLGGLDELQIHELLARRCGRMPSAQLVMSFQRTTSGNPLLVEMLLEQLEDGGHLAVRGDRAIATVDAEALVVSPYLEDAWALRLGKVSEDAHVLLQTAAFIGDGGSVRDLEAISGFDEDEFSALADDLDGAGIITIRDSTYRFCHPLLRHTLVASVPDRQRRSIEAKVAAGLTATPPRAARWLLSSTGDVPDVPMAARMAAGYWRWLRPRPSGSARGRPPHRAMSSCFSRGQTTLTRATACAPSSTPGQRTGTTPTSVPPSLTSPPRSASRASWATSKPGARHCSG